MFSTNPANWVTFEDEPLFQSPQKADGSHSPCRANGLKLLLPKMHESSNQSSSSSNNSLSSPVGDYYFSPGPPSNSPLCTPTKEYPHARTPQRYWKTPQSHKPFFSMFRMTVRFLVHFGLHIHPVCLHLPLICRGVHPL